MSIKKPNIDDDAYFDHAQDFRGELFFMQLDFNEQQKVLNSPGLSKSDIRKIKSKINELVLDLLYEYQRAKEDNKLPQEFKYPN